MKFPFVRDNSYKVGELRAFEKNLLTERQSKPQFSNEVRQNLLPWAKMRNEELAPFLNFLNWQQISDEAEFVISAESHQGPDLSLRFNDTVSTFQLTTAYPHWSGNGGRSHAFRNIALGQTGLAWGASGTKKDKTTGQIVSSPIPVDQKERQMACKLGLETAFRKKLTSPIMGDVLLIYTIGFFLELVDEGYEAFLRPIANELLLSAHQSNHRKRITLVDAFPNSIFDVHSN